MSASKAEEYKGKIERFQILRATNPDLTVLDFSKLEPLDGCTFRRWARIMGIDVNLPKVDLKVERELVDKQSILDGCLLGDGSLFFSDKGNKYPVYSHTSKYREYLTWISSQLEFLNERPIWENSRLDKRTNKTYEAYYIKSLTKSELLEQRNRWYINGKKSVPLDLFINWQSLLHWYLDDGCIIKHQAYLSCEDFTEEEIEFVNSKIVKYSSIPTFTYYNGKNKRIYIPGRYRDAFLELIGKCPVGCFDYKWQA